MARTLMELTMIFIIFCKLNGVYPEEDIQDETILEDLELAREAQDASFFELTNFRRPILMRLNKYNKVYNDNKTYNETYSVFCQYLSEYANSEPSLHEGVGSMKCDGWLQDCSYFHDYIRFKEGFPLEYCESETGELKWAKNEFREYGKKDGKCIQKSVPSGDDSDEYYHKTCLCTCTARPPDSEQRAGWAFSLHSQLADIYNDRVVMGVRIREYNKVIYLEIKEGKIGYPEDGRWRTDRGDSDASYLQYSPLTPSDRSLNLDEIILPPDCVITGVRFRRILKNDGYGQHWVVGMEVEGTPLDIRTQKLKKHQNRWFNTDNMDSSSSDYNRERLKVSTACFSSTFSMDDETNTNVAFDNTLLDSDFGQHVIPYLNTSDIVSDRNQLLNGIRLSYIWKKDCAGYIIPKVLPSEICAFATDTKPRVIDRSKSGLSQYTRKIITKVISPSTCKFKGKRSRSGLRHSHWRY